MADTKLVGQNYTTPDLVAKVTGKAKYAEDYRIEGMLFAKLLVSPHPHARVKRLDTSAALAMPGVKAILTADDMPPRIATGQIPMLVPNPAIRTPRTQIALARNEVCYVGQTVAVVIAELEDEMQEAASRLEFERAASLRDELKAMRDRLMMVGGEG